MITHLLRGNGYALESCGTVADATKMVRDESFNLVISDIGLPDGSGVDMIRAIRKFSSVPAIALTGFGMDQDVATYKEAGFDAHLTKPVNIQRLEMFVHRFVAKDPAIAQTNSP